MKKQDKPISVPKSKNLRKAKRDVQIKDVKVENMKDESKKTTPLDTKQDVNKVARKLPVVPFVLLSTAILLAGFLAFKNKSLFVVAKVDNKFIFSWDLNSKLKERYGQATLDDIVALQLIKNEMVKQKINVSSAEIDSKVSDVRKSLGEVKLEDALKSQNMTMKALKEQLYVQVGVEKLLSSQIQISDEEVAKYITDYGSALSGTDDEKKVEAKNALRDQKMQELVGTWLEQLKAKAKVTKYI